MTRVTAERHFDADAGTVRRAIRSDPESFAAAAGFDEVTVTTDRIEFERSLGVASLELVVELDHDADAVLAFDAVSGIFERMRTEYCVEPDGSGALLTAWTDFTLGGALATAFDGTLVAKQRKREFEAQFDYLEAALETAESTP